ncbi:hypothetical protein VTI28DRAFT_958 [Corynascus sepedonium]
MSSVTVVKQQFLTAYCAPQRSTCGVDVFTCDEMRGESTSCCRALEFNYLFATVSLVGTVLGRVCESFTVFNWM